LAEALERTGNPEEALKRLDGLAERYAGSAALAKNAPKAVPPAVLDYGMVSTQTEYSVPGTVSYVTCDDKAVQVMAWKLPGRLLLGVCNADEKQARDVTLKVDLEKLGLVPRRPWQQFVRAHDLQPLPREAACQLDFHARTLKLPRMEPASGRLVIVRLY